MDELIISKRPALSCNAETFVFEALGVYNERLDKDLRLSNGDICIYAKLFLYSISNKVNAFGDFTSHKNILGEHFIDSDKMKETIKRYLILGLLAYAGKRGEEFVFVIGQTANRLLPMNALLNGGEANLNLPVIVNNKLKNGFRKTK